MESASRSRSVRNRHLSGARSPLTLNQSLTESITQSVNNNTYRNQLRRLTRIRKRAHSQSKSSTKSKRERASFTVDPQKITDLDTKQKIDAFYKTLVRNQHFESSGPKKVGFRRRKITKIEDLSERDLTSFKKFGFNLSKVLDKKDIKKKKMNLISELKVFLFRFWVNF